MNIYVYAVDNFTILCVYISVYMFVAKALKNNTRMIYSSTKMTKPIKNYTNKSQKCYLETAQKSYKIKLCGKFMLI